MDSLIPFLPPLLAFLLGIATHRVILSLFASWLLALLLSPKIALLDTAKVTFEPSKLFVLCFILLSTILFQLMLRSGSLKSLMHYSLKKIKSAKSLETLSLGLSHLFCFDGCFSSLVVSSLMGPLGEKRGVPPVKTALLADSMAGPLVALCPISCFWALVLTMIPTEETMNWHHFSNALPFLFYSLTLIFTIWLVVRKRISIGSMRRYEVQRERNETVEEKGSPIDTLLSLFSLPLFMSILFIYFGFNQLSFVLFLSSFASVSLVSLYALFRKQLQLYEIFSVWKKGTLDSLSTIMMIVIAWSLADLIERELGLSHAIKMLQWEHIADWSVPPLLFFLAALTSTALGTSWGTISIFLPLIGPILFSLTEETPLLQDHLFFYPSLAAIISGAVFGDHVSLLSDTTILASKGARCSPVDHVKTQWPYVIPIAIGTTTGFVLLGIFTQEKMEGGLIVPLVASIITAMTLTLLLDQRKTTLESSSGNYFHT